MVNGHHSPRVNHSDLTQYYININENQTENGTKPILNTPEGIFGLAADISRWELRGDSFHRPRPFQA